MRVIEILREYGLPFIISILIIWGVVFFVLWKTHECPKVNVPEVTKEYINKVKQISDAEDKHTIDSLMLELYGFQPD